MLNDELDDLNPILRALEEQAKLARAGEGIADRLLARANSSIRDIESYVSDTWLLEEDAVRRILEDTRIMRGYRVPRAINLSGRSRDLVKSSSPATPSSIAHELAQLNVVRKQRLELIEKMRRQADVFEKLEMTYSDAAKTIPAQVVERFKNPASVVRFVLATIEVTTLSVSFSRDAFMEALIPALADRAAQAGSIKSGMRNEIRKLEIDLRDFDQEVLIQQWLSEISPPQTEFRWDRPEDLVAQHGQEAARTRERMTQRTVQSFRASRDLLTEAQQIARHNSRIAKLTSALDLVGTVSGLGSELARLDAQGGQWPRSTVINGRTVKLPSLPPLQIIFDDSENPTEWTPLVLGGPQT